MIDVGSSGDETEFLDAFRLAGDNVCGLVG